MASVEPGAGEYFASTEENSYKLDSAVQKQHFLGKVKLFAVQITLQVIILGHHHVENQEEGPFKGRSRQLSNVLEPVKESTGSVTVLTATVLSL